MVVLAAAFGALDWTVLGLYCAVLVGSGIWFSLRENKNTEDYFLAGRRMPAWAVGVSIVATSMSAASFVGVPESSYQGNLTYLATNIGMVLAALVIAFLFIPAFYRGRVQTIYGLLEQRYGRNAKQAASMAFLLGRVLASGARIYIGAIPASMVLFGVDHGLDHQNMLLAIGVMTVIGIAYTLIGGVASVIWTDVLQMIILLGACGAAIVLILLRLEAPVGDAVGALAAGGADGSSKLTILDWSIDPSVTFTVMASVVGFTLMGIGSYGVDQDLAQRMLTCRNGREGAKSVLLGIAMGIPSVALFLVVGLLLWVFYQRPDFFGAAAPDGPPGDTRKVFLEFILVEMPAGMTGLMMAGLIAAGLSSLNSAINAMSSAFVCDIYRRYAPGRNERHYLFVGRIGVVGWGLVLGGFACVCVFWQTRGGQFREGGTLLTFALTVMTFAYAGLIAVFMSVLVTKRGNGTSAIAALITGFLSVLATQEFAWSWIVDFDALRRSTEAGGGTDWRLWVVSLAFPWKLTIATALSFGVCQLGPGAREADAATPIAAR